MRSHRRPEGPPDRASMTDTQQREGTTSTRHTVVVPNSINMVSLLGPGDEHLGLIEQAFAADIHVRGNRITLYGEPGEVALAERLLDELVTIIRTGQGVTGETVERVLHMLRAETTERPADVLSLNILSNRGRSIRPKTLNQKRYVDSIDKHTITFGDRPGRHRQDLPGHGQGGAGAAVQERQPDHPDPAGGRGRRAARLPARHAQREDRPLPAAAVRRPARHDRPRLDPEAARRRDDRGGARWPTCAAGR